MGLRLTRAAPTASSYPNTPPATNACCQAVLKIEKEKPKLKKLSKWIQKISKGWVALASIIIFISFTALVLPQQASQAAMSTGSDKSPDMSLFYTSNDLYQIAEEYGEGGRMAYVKARFSFDLIWPLVYMVFLSTVLSWLFKKVFKANSFWQLFNLVPIFGLIFDYLENISTSLVMIRYPNPTNSIAIFAPIFTVLKWLCVGGSFVLLLIGLIIWGWQLIKGKGEWNKPKAA